MDVEVGIGVQVLVGTAVSDGSGVCDGIRVLVGNMMMTEVSVMVGVLDGARVATLGTYTCWPIWRVSPELIQFANKN